MFTAVTCWRLSLGGGTSAAGILTSAVIVGAVAYAAATLLLMRSELYATKRALLQLRG
jgi:hypothetical protein